MAELGRLSKREWEVVKLLLQGKSNKLIASGLGISDRTVEFHLKNIYSKYQVSSRIELILKLGNATGRFEFENPGSSTVAGKGESVENRGRLNSRMGWAASFRDVVSISAKELEMKQLFNSKQVPVGVVTALFAGFAWIFGLLASRGLPLSEVKLWILLLIGMWTMIGLSVGVVGKRNGSSLSRVFLSTLLGTGMSPFAIIPFMLIAVLSLGKLAEWAGLIEPASMSGEVATTLATIAMIGLWLVIGSMLGSGLLFVSIQKPEQAAERGL